MRTAAPGQRQFGVALLLALLLLGGLMLAPRQARAATIEVTNGNDSDNGSLRAAIETANTSGSTAFI
jgi:hypothetical protein